MRWMGGWAAVHRQWPFFRASTCLRRSWTILSRATGWTKANKETTNRKVYAIPKNMAANPMKSQGRQSAWNYDIKNKTMYTQELPTA